LPAYYRPAGLGILLYGARSVQCYPEHLLTHLQAGRFDVSVGPVIAGRDYLYHMAPAVHVAPASLADDLVLFDASVYVLDIHSDFHF
jgi:hypothetical protein